MMEEEIVFLFECQHQRSLHKRSARCLQLDRRMHAKPSLRMLVEDPTLIPRGSSRTRPCTPQAKNTNRKDQDLPAAQRHDELHQQELRED